MDVGGTFSRVVTRYLLEQRRWSLDDSMEAHTIWTRRQKHIVPNAMQWDRCTPQRPLSLLRISAVR